MRTFLLAVLLWGCSTSAWIPHTTSVVITGVVIAVTDETHWINNTRTTLSPIAEGGYVTVTTDYMERIGFIGDTLTIRLSYKHSDIEREVCRIPQYWVLTHPDGYNENYGGITYQILRVRRP